MKSMDLIHDLLQVSSSQFGHWNISGATTYGWCYSLCHWVTELRKRGKRESGVKDLIFIGDSAAWLHSICSFSLSNSSRTQHMTNKSEPIGLGHLGTQISVGDKPGYCACYRHRMSAHSNDQFTSPVDRDVHFCDSASHSLGKDRPGRVLGTQLPDNIYFVVEGQHHSDITSAEKEYWHDNLESYATPWMEALFPTGPDSGIWGSRMCYAPESGVFRDSTPKALNYNTKAQLFYFKGLRHMERIGRSNKLHVELRKRFMEAYGPGGVMQSGKLVLWVETTVLKNGEI